MTEFEDHDVMVTLVADLITETICESCYRLGVDAIGDNDSCEEVVVTSEPQDQFTDIILD